MHAPRSMLHPGHTLWSFREMRDLPQEHFLLLSRRNRSSKRTSSATASSAHHGSALPSTENGVALETPALPEITIRPVVPAALSCTPAGTPPEELVVKVGEPTGHGVVVLRVAPDSKQ